MTVVKLVKIKGNQPYACFNRSVQLQRYSDIQQTNLALKWTRYINQQESSPPPHKKAKNPIYFPFLATTILNSDLV